MVGEFCTPRLPRPRDTTPVLDDALEQMGSVEQETIHLHATSVPESANAELRSPATLDQVRLEPVPAADGLRRLFRMQMRRRIKLAYPDDFDQATAVSAEEGLGSFSGANKTFR